MRLEKEITSSDVAQLRGVSERTARRWMRALFEVHGTTIVFRRGNRYITTAIALEKVASPTSRVDGVESRLTLLEESQLDQDERMNGISVRLSGVERASVARQKEC